MVEGRRSQRLAGRSYPPADGYGAAEPEQLSPAASGRVVLNELWREVTSGRVSSVALAASACDVVLGESGGRVSCYDILGVLRWTFDCGRANPYVATTAEGKRTAVLAEGTLWWLDDQGQVLWQKPSLTGLVVVDVDRWGRRIVAAGEWQRSLVLAPSGRELGELDLLLVARFIVLSSLSGRCVLASEFGDVAAFDLAALELTGEGWLEGAATLRRLVDVATGAGGREGRARGAAQGRLWQRRLAMPVSDLAVSESGELILLASPQERVHAFNGEGERLGTYAVGARPSAVACDWAGSVLFFANGERQLLMMGRHGGLRFLQHTREPVVWLATDAGGRRLLAVDGSGEAVLYEVARAEGHRSAFLEFDHEVPRRTAPSVTVSETWQREVFPLTEYLKFGRLLVSGAGEVVAFIDAHQRLMVFDRSGTQLINLRLRGAFPDLRRAGAAEVLLAYTDRWLVLVRAGVPEPTTMDHGPTAVTEARVSEDGSLVLAASEFGEMTLFAGGSVLWRRELGCLPAALAVARAEGLAVALGDDGRLVAWDLSGEEVWRQSTGVEDVLEALLMGETLIVVRRSGGVAAVGRWGEVRWRRRLASECLQAYAVGDYVVLGESGGVLVVVTVEGEVVERHRAESEDAVVVRDKKGRLLVVDVVEGQVCCVGPEGGGPVWKYAPPDHVSYLSASADGGVVAVVVARALALVEPMRRPRSRTEWAGYLEL